MKNLATIIIMMLCVNVFAQRTTDLALTKILEKTLPQYKFTPSARTESLELRMIGIRETVWDGAIYGDLDSANMSYSGDNSMERLDLLNGSFDDCFIVQFDGFVWVPYAKIINTFTGGNRTELLLSYWDGAVYTETERITFTYDAGLMQQALTEFDYGAGFENYTRDTYFYTLDDKLDYYTDETWTGADWENNSRYIYSYDGEGRTSTILYQGWTGLDYEDDSRTVFVYDGVGNLSTKTGQYADGIGGFDDSNRDIYEYDGDNFLIYDTYQSFSVVWENYSRYTYDNNTNGLPDIADFGYWDGAIFAPYLKQYYTYEEYSTSAIDNIDETAIHIYPNPASTELNADLGIGFEYADYQIIDINGRVVLSSNCDQNGNMQVDLENNKIIPGTYFLKLNTDSETKTMKFIVQ